MFCHLIRTVRRKRAGQPRLSELGSEGPEGSGLLVCKRWTHLDSFPSTSPHHFEFGSDYPWFVLAVPITTGEHPKEIRSCEGPAAAFRSLFQAIGSSPCSSGQRACRQQQAALQSRPRWLRNQDPPPSLAQRDAWPRKTPLPRPAPRPGVGAGWAIGSRASLCNPEGAAQQKQPAAPESLSCSGEQSTSAAVVLGSDASTMTSPAWICMVYLHKHAGFSILPFLSGSLCLACLPVLPAPQPLSLPLSAGLRAASSLAVRSPCQALFSPQIKSPPLLPGFITTAHAADPNTLRASPRGRQLRQGHAHACASPTHPAEDLVLLWSPPSQEKTILQSPALAELAKVQTAYLPAAHLNPSPRLYCAPKGPLCSLGQPSSPPPHQEASPPCKQGARGGQEERGDIPKCPGHEPCHDAGFCGPH